MTVCHKRSVRSCPILNVHYLQALCENLRVDFSRDSINAVTGHSMTLKKSSENRILISYRNFSQTALAEDSRGAENRMHAVYTGFSKTSPKIRNK